MKKSRFISALALVAVVLLAVSCEKKEIITFGGEMDKFTVAEPDGSKVYLGHAEQWLYWEDGDDIKVYVGDGGDATRCYLISGSGSLQAYFKSVSPVPSGALHAIYPYASGGGSYTSLIFPATQPYRTTTDPTHPDSSFGIGAMPMVAYEVGGTDAVTNFHTVAGILRLQFYSSTVETVQSITFKEVSATPKQISGPFTVHDINENMPWLTATDAATPANQQITITGINTTIGPSGTQLLTFYLPLPAVDGNSTYTNYKLEVTINAAGNKVFRRTLGADIHRRNITMMPALHITEWSTSGGSGNQGNHQINLVGSGTKDRPFQIYTAGELIQVRDAFSTGGTVIINGQEVVGVPPSGNTDEATHFKIVRSDIVLNSDNWEAGISNFKGYMYFASSTATNGGITNNSAHPLFESIASNGVVHRVYVKGSSTPTVSGAFSPMCGTNNGKMVECHNKCAVTISEARNLAGLCVTNNGKIIGGANEASLTTAGGVAGICVNNNASGSIQGSFDISSAVPHGATVGGIALNNYGSVKDCQVSVNTTVSSTGDWGVIVYDNKTGGIIDNCISTGGLAFTIEGSLGGICNINSGTVCNCSNNVELRASTGNVGGIVATMDNATAEVYNCCTEGLHYVIGAIGGNVADYCGGIVGWLNQGAVRNCYNNCRVEGAINTGGILGYISAEAGAVVENCWDGYGHDFIGQIATGAVLGDFCFSSAALAPGCNHFASTGANRWQVTEMLDGQDAATTYVGQHLSAPLNDWVEGHDGKYYKWTTNTAVYPKFNTSGTK